MALAEPKKYSKAAINPGQAAAGRINYELREETMRYNVLPQVQQARKEVLDEYSPDILGCRKQQWNASNETTKSKHMQHISDDRLSNTLTPTHINTDDYRTLRATTFSPDTIKEHVFTRGDVTTGWNHSNVVDLRQRQANFEALNEKARSTSSSKAATLPTYMSPVQRQTMISETIRSKKLAGETSDNWLGTFVTPVKVDEGEESDSRTRSSVRRRPLKSDVEAVKALDFPGYESDEG